MTGFRRGRRIALDVGSVRVGVASCDPDGILATPLEVVRRDDDATAVSRIAALVAEQSALEIVAGRPRSLDGSDRAAVGAAEDFLRAVAAAVDVPIRLVDERFTTVQAHGVLQSAGRNSRQRREIVDAVAAVLILQAALDTEKSGGSPAGTPLDE
ncbi:MAG: Holliday junction resolvase RuvX [Brevibacterium yomogidense]|uniref:Putative pre-16S rRNA nuclease n=1 Tax=Brevibacterium yomogidense TaxID=946573 RepID=A0A1X6XGJ1_9MICO|nr:MULTISPECIES: Holliday junction resolvase RuvX [Brevibacterium]SLM98223.1 Putative Holliday junction resolvase YggF [Brevibacterium yomogidense]SMX67916.1 putative holliday junction resolvase [Brevibacterium sp. Mu109]